MAKRFDFSILKEHVDEEMDGMDRIGFCMQRFKADLTMREAHFKALHVGDIIDVNDRKVLIVKIGKECFEGCSVYDNRLYCPLKLNCAFGMWID